MPSFIFNQLSKFKARPVSAITLYFGSGYFIEFANLETDTSYNIAPITKPDDRGGERTVAWRMNIVAYPMQDNYADMTPPLLAKLNALFDVQLHLGTVEPYLADHPVPMVNSTGGAVFDLGSGCSGKWGIDSRDFGRRMKLDITKVYKITDAEFASLFSIEE